VQRAPLWSDLAAVRTGKCALAAGGEHADAESVSMTMTSSDDELLEWLRLSRLVEGGSIAARGNGARSLTASRKAVWTVPAPKTARKPRKTGAATQWQVSRT